jgi:hypothetical protein
MGSVGSGKAVDAGSLNTSPYIALRIDRSQHRGSFECVGLLLRLLLGIDPRSPEMLKELRIVGPFRHKFRLGKLVLPGFSGW